MTLSLTEPQFSSFIQYMKEDGNSRGLSIKKAASHIGLQPPGDVWVLGEQKWKTRPQKIDDDPALLCPAQPLQPPRPDRRKSTTTWRSCVRHSLRSPQDQTAENRRRPGTLVSGSASAAPKNRPQKIDDDPALLCPAQPPQPPRPDRRKSTTTRRSCVRHSLRSPQDQTAENRRRPGALVSGSASAAPKTRPQKIDDDPALLCPAQPPQPPRPDRRKSKTIRRSCVWLSLRSPQDQTAEKRRRPGALVYGT